MTGPAVDAGTFDRAGCRSAAALEHYREHGWMLVKGFYDVPADIEPVHRHVNHLIDLKLRQHGQAPARDGATIDSDAFMRLCAVDRALGGEVYRASRHLLPLHQLAAHPRALDLARALMQTDFINFIPYTAMRIDVRGEEKYLFPWHQDYPYIQGSMDGIVIWVPLFQVDPARGGGVELIAGSHRDGLCPVELVDPDNRNRNGAHTIRIADTGRFDRMPTVAPSVEPGDALVFHTLLVHRSVPMQEGTVRWTTQIRYANFSFPDAVRRGWPGGMIEGVGFESAHPEYITGARP